jgi:antitoxin component YwqK of YwqJK toxin-antitoxin module
MNNNKKQIFVNLMKQFKRSKVAVIAIFICLMNIAPVIAQQTKSFPYDGKLYYKDEKKIYVGGIKCKGYEPNKQHVYIEDLLGQAQSDVTWTILEATRRLPKNFGQPTVDMENIDSFYENFIQVTCVDNKGNPISGTFYQYRKTGAGNEIIIREVGFSDGKLNGIFKNYFGKELTAEMTFKDGKPDGVAKQYGSYEVELNFSNGKLEGIQKLHDSDGTEILSFKDGKPNGSDKKYNKSDILVADKTYKNGKLNGIVKTFYDSGQLEISKTYIDGIGEGEYKEYNEAGKLIKEMTFKNDELDGSGSMYDSDGRIIAEGNFKDGQLDGIQKEYYYYDGTIKTLKRQELYKNGKLIEVQYDKDKEQ